jgi:magnesium-transporting ATPase (P-type)
LKVYDIVEKSYNPQAEIKGITKDSFKNIPILRDIAVVCSLNNKAGLVYEDGKFNKQGEPTEAALKVFGEKLGQYDASFSRDTDATKNPEGYAKFLDKKYPYVATLDFTSERKTMSTVIRGLQNGNSLLLKGAPERIIEKSDFYKKADGSEAKFTQDEKKKLID